ncbi:aminotransferase class I/II-fold pyridoxal phosphate-dependent enzyme [Glacieibacterium megasporae]|uniref:aminotransferase class I/II-fold pyridoxal phosphate-dependent enzyme n=1 Tax=Glacieibacterium megasporae TaxID=2835787 RepID=UPI001C1DF067|nr:aminotransferase class I/II-fold pyridoxal phosphate-dependent enzyme [Polymorphobacter megasporae]UAJ09121.1 aminotransferase class I/II-fold pyridoxal phosphate-dependent enzyme [Polymorphobacter megasporae]
MAPLTEHGGRVDAARSLYPDAPLPWLDLSTGINPSAWTPAVDPLIDLRALPSPSSLAALEAVAASRFGALPAQVAALPGTELGLRLLNDVGLPPPYRYVAPGYGTHRDIFPEATAIAADALETAADSGGTILIANPNNPDGRRLDPQRLSHIAARLDRSGGRLIIDEAFADAMPNISMVPHLGSRERVIVLRSFGKFFGLAGVRLGFVIAPDRVLASIRRRLGSWPVSATAIALGRLAYADTKWIAAMRVQLIDRANALDEVLRGHGLVAVGDCPLFRLVEGDASSLFDRLARKGILTRPFDYAPRWLRFGVPGNPADLVRLDSALRG